MRLGKVQKRILVYLRCRVDWADWPKNPKKRKWLERSHKRKYVLGKTEPKNTGTYWAIARNVYGLEAIRDRDKGSQAYYVKRGYYAGLLGSIARLEKRGLVKKEYPPRASRKRRDKAVIRLTAEGRRVADRVYNEMKDFFVRPNTESSFLEELAIWSPWFPPAYNLHKKLCCDDAKG